MPLKICIIGAGLSGLAAIKSCLDEDLDPVCLEQESHIGGTWQYTEDTGLKRACVAKSLLMNTSRFTSVFSDFPGKKDDPMFWDHQEFLEYQHQYADHFDLLKYVKFGTTVTKVVPVENNSDMVKWKVEYEASGLEHHDVYDGVMMCSGLFHEPSYPDIPGLEKFKGTVLHTHDYRRPEPYTGKKILVIG